MRGVMEMHEWVRRAFDPAAFVLVRGWYLLLDV